MAEEADRVVQKELEREVYDMFTSMKKPPPRKSINSADPTISELSEQLLSRVGEEFMDHEGSPVIEVAEYTPPVNYMEEFVVYHSNRNLDTMSKLRSILRSLTINSLRLLSEAEESKMLIDRVFDQKEEVVWAFSTLLEDMDRGASIQQSRALLRAWKQVSTHLDRDLILGSAGNNCPASSQRCISAPLQTMQSLKSM